MSTAFEIPSSVDRPLSSSEWRERKRAHETRVGAWTDPHQDRAARGEKHPVRDFLFTYYSFRPAWLKQWHPGPDVVLEDADEFLRWPEYEKTGAGVTLRSPLATVDQPSPNLRLASRLQVFIPWLRSFLAAVQTRPAFFGCAGAHEWAMVYKPGARGMDRRHSEWPLRYSDQEVARIVESLPICCTHFDAFRFFTPEARPLNRFQLSREATVEHDQRGCLHANMDLYKWAFKLAPYAPSELVADCFFLAADIREIDMRASPYDLRALGYAPIEIETPAGRLEYERHQREFARRSEPLRERLVALCDRLLA